MVLQDLAIIITLSAALQGTLAPFGHYRDDCLGQLGQVTLFNNVRRRKINNIAKRPEPNPPVDSLFAKPVYVYQIIHLHNADRSLDPDVDDALEFPTGLEADIQPVFDGLYLIEARFSLKEVE